MIVEINANDMLIKVILPKLFKMTKSDASSALKPPIVVNADVKIALPIFFIRNPNSIYS